MDEVFDTLAGLRCLQCVRLDRWYPCRRAKATEEMVSLWHKLWMLAQNGDHEYWKIRSHIKERFPNDIHYRPESCSCSPYFNIGATDWVMLWQEIYQNGF